MVATIMVVTIMVVTITQAITMGQVTDMTAHLTRSMSAWQR